MSIRICICDDCPADLDRIRTLTEDWASAGGYTVFPETFPSAEAFLFRYGEDRRCDILLLDIEMTEGGRDGIRLARELRADGCRAEIVFITSHGEFWDAGYEVDALHYLTKPVNPVRLAAVLDKAAERTRKEPESIVLTCDGETFKIPKPEILYVEASLHYCTVCTTGGVYRVKESISSFGDRLGKGFFRIHRGVLVSLSHITRISRSSVFVGSVELPLARGNYDAVNRAFIEYN